MITALGPRLGLGLRLDFGSQVWFVQYFSEKKVIVLYALGVRGFFFITPSKTKQNPSFVGNFWHLFFVLNRILLFAALEQTKIVAKNGTYPEATAQ